MITPADVTAIIVTRGDVDLQPILDTLIFPEVIVWDNSTRPADLGAGGRYAALAEASNPVAYFQDDDCTVTPEAQQRMVRAYEDGVFLSNMNPNHNGGFFPFLALPGYGSLVRGDLPAEALERWRAAYPEDYETEGFIRVGADIVVGTMLPSRMIDFGHDSFAYAHAATRTWRQPGYRDVKALYYERAAELRKGILWSQR